MMTAVVRLTTITFGNIFQMLCLHVIMVKPGPFPDYQIYLRTTRFPNKVVMLTTRNVGNLCTPELCSGHVCRVQPRLVFSCYISLVSLLMHVVWSLLLINWIYLPFDSTPILVHGRSTCIKFAEI